MEIIPQPLTGETPELVFFRWLQQKDADLRLESAKKRETAALLTLELQVQIAKGESGSVNQAGIDSFLREAANLESIGEIIRPYLGEAALTGQMPEDRKGELLRDWFEAEGGAA